MKKKLKTKIENQNEKNEVFFEVYFYFFLFKIIRKKRSLANLCGTRSEFHPSPVLKPRTHTHVYIWMVKYTQMEGNKTGMEGEKFYFMKRIEPALQLQVRGRSAPSHIRIDNHRYRNTEVICTRETYDGLQQKRKKGFASPNDHSGDYQLLDGIQFS